jgi:hypothetical protein
MRKASVKSSECTPRVAHPFLEDAVGHLRRNLPDAVLDGAAVADEKGGNNFTDACTPLRLTSAQSASNQIESFIWLKPIAGLHYEK